MLEIPGTYTTARVMIDEVEPSCLAQIAGFVNHPAFTNPVVVMPDTHAGIGSVIGFTMRMTEKIIPNVVGVDIGCGMRAFEIGPNLPLSLEELDRKIRTRIPFGHDFHDRPVMSMKKEFPWHEARVLAEKFAAAYLKHFGVRIAPPKYSEEWFRKKCAAIGGDLKRMTNSLGTLGGGNHYIETGRGEGGEYWITVHSGSRNFGKRICEYWQSIAVKRMKKGHRAELQRTIEEIRAAHSGREIYRQVKAAKKEFTVDAGARGLEWLEGADAAGYLFDMIFSQVYARVNREWMARLICDLLKTSPLRSIETVHNYIDFGDFMIRKGAIRSYAGETMVIPLTMRDGMLLCEGASNPGWNFSAPHGAGRVLSRTQARRQVDLGRFRRQMDGIYSTSVGPSTLDESPDAYKDPACIERAIRPTATILDRIRPVHNMKDVGGGGRKRKR